MKDLRGSVVVITGAVGDLGREICTQMAKNEGAHIWACDIDELGLAALEKHLKAFSKHIHTGRVDVSDIDQMRSFAKTVLEHEGKIDVWFNNAGISSGLCVFSESNQDRFDKVIDINFQGVVRGTRVALDIMNEQSFGVVVNISSVAGLVAAPYMSAYSASKHAVVGFTRAIQTELELADSPVKTLLVSPGFFISKMIDSDDNVKFPDWLRWILSDAASVTKETITALKRGKTEVICAANGKMLNRFHTFMPKMARHSAKLGLARTWKDLLLNRFHF